MTKFEIIWPERRWVDERKIAMWFSDAIANGEIDESYANDPMFADPFDGPERKARELNDIGTITLGRGRA